VGEGKGGYCRQDSKKIWEGGDSESEILYNQNEVRGKGRASGSVRLGERANINERKGQVQGHLGKNDPVGADGVYLQ
jgi:hypothetical protein